MGETSMKLFVTGASRCIGGSVAKRLHDAGHEVLGLVGSEEKARMVKEHGIEPIVGTLNDATILQDAARQADGVINAASSDDRGAVEAFVAAWSAAMESSTQVPTREGPRPIGGLSSPVPERMEDVAETSY
jgi:nucleoside-diphosphate-sugar epimerase